MTPSKNRSLGSPEFQISKFFDFGHFEPDITDFVKNLWREMTPSQIWILGSEHGLRHGHSWASMSKHRASTSKFWEIFRFWAFGVRYHWFCEEFMKGTDTLQNLDFGEWERLEHGHSRASMSKQRLSTSKHEQILEFSDFGCFEPDITDFVFINENDTFQK